MTEYDDNEEKVAILEPVAVTAEIKHTVRTRDMGTQNPSYANFVFAGAATDQPILLLPRDPWRKRAVLSVQGANVYIGTERQIRTGIVGSGFLLTQAMGILELQNQDAVWAMVASAATATISVLNERYAET